MKTNINGLKIFRLKATIRGAVQGVGFRPFVFRLATEMKLTGWVLNSVQGVFIEVEGEKAQLDKFIIRLQNEKPNLAFIQSLEFSFLDPIGFTDFEIRESYSLGNKTALVLPDIATCPDCLKDIFDSSNRRYLYPFTNCTNCGPRFSIIESLPYDRQNTSIKIFVMCEECKAEYENPLNRRFHAQPNACPNCGPHLELWNEKGVVLAKSNDALSQAVEAIRSCKIVAVKGIGGFHLITDARNNEAVRKLRERKHREEKPFALMFPSLQAVQDEFELNNLEIRLLSSPESPIVLLYRLAENKSSKISSLVAPNNPYLGIMLPYTPLHHILMRELGFPVVATSGNLSDEPICIDEREALRRLSGIADLFLVHNRPIVRHVDDSIVRIVLGRELVLRRARGYAPLPINIGAQYNIPVLAVGAHLKNTTALMSGGNVFISQHIGDLETSESLNAFENVISDFQNMYNIKPAVVVYDSHPEYISTKYAKNLDIDSIDIQHHYAHIASCMAENQLEGKVLGVSWDGTGYGTDGTIWGGEFLLADETTFERVATFRSFQLPGGEKAIKEPRRTALGVLFEIFGTELFERNDLPIQAFTHKELEVIKQMLEKKLHSPITTSAGRLFDAVASLIGLRQIVNFEGQAAMELEFLATNVSNEDSYEPKNYKIEIIDKRQLFKENQIKNTTTSHKSLITIDWRPIIEGIINDLNNKLSNLIISLKFHNTLVEIIVTVAKKINVERVLLSGGCFQNKILTEKSVNRLINEGFRPYWHQRVPPNDGGISLGQAFIAYHGRINKI